VEIARTLRVVELICPVLNDIPGNDPIRSDAIAVESSVFKCLYRDETGEFVRGFEGGKLLPPASSFERPWSERRDPYFRNVEAVGSNPITST